MIKRVGERTFGGYGVVFDTVDLEGDYFTKDTDFWLDSVDTKTVLYDHTMTPHPFGMSQNDEGDWLAKEVDPRLYEIGKITKRVVDEQGIYFEFRLHDTTPQTIKDRLSEWNDLLDEEYQQWLKLIERRLEDNQLNFSTDSIAHLVKREFNSEKGAYWLKSWAIPFISVTHHAAEPNAKIKVVKKVFDLPIGVGDTHEATHEATRETQSDGSTVKHDQGDNHMSKTIDLDPRLFIEALVDSQWDQIKSLFVKAEGEDPEPDMPNEDADKGELDAQFRPIAEQIAGFLPISVDEALADLMSYIASKLQPADATDMVDEEDPPMMLNIDMSKLADEVAKRSQTKGAAVHNNGGGFRVKNVNYNRRDPEKQPSFARFIKALSKPNELESMQFLHSYGKKSRDAWKAQGINPDTAGGYLTTPDRNNEVIENLRAEAVVANLVRNVPMNSDRLEIPRLDTGIDAEMVGENSQIPTDEAVFGNVTAYAKKIAVMVKLSSEIVDDSDPDVEQVIMEDISRAVAEKLDTQILRGTGVGEQLLGIDYQSGVTSTAAGGGSLSYDDLVQAQERLEESNIRIDNRVQWLLDPKGKRIVREIEDSAGRLIFTGGGEGTQMSGTVPSYLLDYTWTQSNLLVPAGTSARKIYLAQWQDCVLGMRKALEFKSSDQAGTAFEYDQVWIRAVIRVAFLLRHGESVQIITGITSAETAA